VNSPLTKARISYAEAVRNLPLFRSRCFGRWFVEFLKNHQFQFFKYFRIKESSVLVHCKKKIQNKELLVVQIISELSRICSSYERTGIEVRIL
jgi:hypothetical protein